MTPLSALIEIEGQRMYVLTMLRIALIDATDPHNTRGASADEYAISAAVYREFDGILRQTSVANLPDVYFDTLRKLAEKST